MAEQVDLETARTVMEQAVRASLDPIARSTQEFVDWSRSVRKFSELCAERNLKSYIAVLGNALLAKASNPRIDAYSLKAGDESGGAYDARRSAEKVLVPASQEHRFSLGATGPQPLNNQPFFRSYRITREMRVRGHARDVLDELLKLLHEIQQYRSEEATRALAAFVDVRREYVPKYSPRQGTLAISSADELAAAIHSLVAEKSEGGGRAQAAAGGLLDALFSPERVRVGKRNEPDREAPGDICIRAEVETEHSYQIQDRDHAPDFTRAFEVRDKNVPPHAVLAFVEKVAQARIGRAALIAVAPNQEPLDVTRLSHRARESGVDLQIFIGWELLVDFIVFASIGREARTLESAVASIHNRLISLEVSEQAVREWDRLTMRVSPGEKPAPP